METAKFKLLQNFPGMDYPIGSIFFLADGFGCYSVKVNGKQLTNTIWDADYFITYPNFFKIVK